jgi:hypothetical protein
MRAVHAPKRSKDVRVGYIAFALCLEELLSGPCTARALAEHSGLHYRTACRLLRTMHDKKVAHIAGWEKDSLGRCAVAAYGLGPGNDAKRTTKSREEVNRGFRSRRAAAPMNGTPFAGLGARA